MLNAYMMVGRYCGCGWCLLLWTTLCSAPPSPSKWRPLSLPRVFCDGSVSEVLFI